MSAATGEAIHSLGVLAAVSAAVVQLTRVYAADRRNRAVRGRGTLLLATDPNARQGWWAWATRTIRGGSDPPTAASSDMPVTTRRQGGGESRRGLTGVVRWAAPAGAGLAGWMLVGDLMGCAVGAAAAYGTWRRQASRARGSTREARAERAVIAGQLPLVADLLAACVTVGAGPREAAEAVGESVGGPVGERLAGTAAEIRLGGDPAEAWGRFGEMAGAGPLARCLYRAGATGAPAAEPVSRLGEAIRAERAAAAVARAQRAGVLITAPVGLCFLPAFLAVGVAPVIMGLAGSLLAAR
ncbi:type II secretion system F family protein [Streptomyces sp. NPDC088729]|uniref:type II secretion system F family protein n=1 Tax=Streptomyces sp. NPDC088729 TaxID=3365876 RepID=UPI0037F868E0